MSDGLSQMLEFMRGLEQDHGPNGYPAVQMCDITRLVDEIERLRAALARANEQAERFERGWYLRGDALELIAAPKRPDGTWNRDREACRLLAERALRGEA